MKKLFLLFAAGLLLSACQPKQQEPEGPVAPLKEMPAVKDVAMYQVNPRVFAPEKSLRAVADRIDSIKALGVNVMWVMPIYPIGIEKGKNSPYCIQDYKAIAPEFGTLNDFKYLARTCHEHGMAIILDWVANHTAWDHPWVKEHPDWYTHDAEADTIIHPRPWEWYDVADLNYDNREMRLAMIDAMKYWICDVGIDGFRCDVADGVPADFWKEAIDTLRQAAGKRQILMLAEGKRADNFTAGFDMNYGWDFKDQIVRVFNENQPASSLFDADKAEYDSLPAGKVKLRFTTNHDHSTEKTPPVEFLSLRGSMAAYVASVFLHGGALIYGSQEVGYPEPIISSSMYPSIGKPTRRPMPNTSSSSRSTTRILRCVKATSYPSPTEMCLLSSVISMKTVCSYLSICVTLPSRFLLRSLGSTRRLPTSVQTPSLRCATLFR